MPKSNWVATFYRSSNDTSTSTYSEILKTTVTGLSGYQGRTGSNAGGSDLPYVVYIVAPQKTKEMTGELLTDVSGWTDGIISVRDVFNIELWPFLYTASATEPDLDDWETLADWLNAYNNLWVSIQGNARYYPSDTTKAHPVAIEAVSESVNKTAGTHNVVLTLRVKGLR